nr:unnamed protein product [Callosobruchus analis]
MLYLSGNKLVSLPESFAEIKTLDISYNSISKIDPSVDFYTIIFNGSNNDIKVFDTSNFSVIQELHLANNAIKKFYIVNDNNTLEKLDLYSNSLADIPENIYNLKVLNLGANAISSLPNGTLNSSLLEDLNLSANNLTYIPSLTLKHLSLLRFLDLSRNRISSFTFGTFDGLDVLRVLNISYNRFKVLPFRTFHALKNLTEIDFSGNQINDINIDALFEHLPILALLDFRGNMFSCHKLLEIVHSLENREVSFIRGTYVEGENIYGIKCTDFNELIDVKENTDSIPNNTSYSALISYLNYGFKDSRFAQYLEELRNSSDASNVLTDIKQFLRELIERARKQNDYFEKLTKQLEANSNSSEHEYGKNKVLEIEKVLSENGKHFNRSIENDKKLSEVLNKIAIELNGNTAKDFNLYKALLSLRQILNDTTASNKNDRDLFLKKFSDLDTDIKKLLDAFKTGQLHDFKLMSDILGKIQSNASMVVPKMFENSSLELSRAEKLGVHSKNEVTLKTSPVLILIAILLVVIAVLFLGFGISYHLGLSILLTKNLTWS